VTRPTRAETLDRGALDEAQGERLAVRVFEVERQASPAAQQQVVAQRAWDAEIASPRPIDAQHRGAEVGEQPWRVFRKVWKFDQGAGRGGAGTEQ
jgi:hypothetical protein